MDWRPLSCLLFIPVREGVKGDEDGFVVTVFVIDSLLRAVYKLDFTPLRAIPWFRNNIFITWGVPQPL